MKPVMGDITYSTWNRATQSWDYWHAPVSMREGVIAPPPKISSRKLGVSPEEAARKLPPGAKHVGSGAIARGMVAERVGFGGVAAETGKLLGVGALVLLAYHFWSTR